MKKDIHPDYKEVVFWDTSSDFKFMSRSTLKTKETIKWTDGKDYPVRLGRPCREIPKEIHEEGVSPNSSR